MRILLVEDDIHLGDALCEALSDQRYVVDVARDGEQGWEQVLTLPYDLILLDVTLPKLDGMSLCQRIRTQGYQQPLMMLTARDTSADKISGLDAGADDYIVKPFDLLELLARVRALLRRGHFVSSPQLQWGQLCLNPSLYEVTYGDRPLRLTPKEFALLEVLLRNGRRVISRAAMIEHVWALEDPPEEDTVKAHIKGLRHKIKAAGGPDDLIETVHGLGYRLKQLALVD